MAAKGRRGVTVRTPARLKLLEGTRPGRDSGGRAVRLPPGFRRLPPEPPPWLSGAALDEWHRVVPELQRLGLTKPSDAAALTAYCLAWQRMVDGQAIIAAEGLLGENSQGRVRHPAVAVVEAASKEIRAWAAQFGLSPAAEAGLAVPEITDGGDDNPFAGGGSPGGDPP